MNYDLLIIYISAINVLIGIILMYRGVKEDITSNILTGGIVSITGVFIILIQTGVLER